MIKIYEMVRVALDYIEKESEFWDAEDLNEYGLSYLFTLIQQAVCKSMFRQMLKGLDDLSVEDLEEESIYFYYDCILKRYAEYVDIQNEKNEEITYRQFYSSFIKFIQYMHQIEVRKDMG